MLNKFVTVLKLLGTHILRVLSYCVPRSDTTLVCIGWHNGEKRELFADNSKYFFLYLQNKHPHLTSVWLAKDRILASVLRQEGLCAYYMHSPKGIYYALRAGHTIIDAHLHARNWKFSGGSKITQLWHGKGMKKSGHTSNRNKKHSHFVNPGYRSHYDSIFATSEKTATLLSLTFSQPVGDITVTGHPRTDLLYKDIPGAKIDGHHEFEKKIHEIRKGGVKKIILYAPTFRPDGSNPLTTFDVTAANTFMKKRNYHMMVSLHPKFSAQDSGISEENSNLTYISAGYDIYPQLQHVDMLITDYSSLYVDFLLLDKPIIFYVYDLDWYKKESGLYEEFDTLTPGPHPQTFDELLTVIEADDTHKNERVAVRNTLFTYTEGQSSQRIAESLGLITNE